MTTQSSLPAACVPPSTRPRARRTEQGLCGGPSNGPPPARRNMTLRSRIVAAVLAGLALAGSGSTVAAVEKFRHLTGAQIRDRIVGMELGDDVHWLDSFRR